VKYGEAMGRPVEERERLDFVGATDDRLAFLDLIGIGSSTSM
jgi:hypothetical protein